MRCGWFRPPVLLVPRAVLLGRHPSQLLAVSSRLPPRASAEMMRTMLAAVLGAAFLGGADAVPAQNLYSSVEITTTHALGSALSSSTHHDLLGAFEASVASAVGAEYEHDVSVTISGTEHRRLQAGSSSLTITYVVSCGNSCDSFLLRPLMELCHCHLTELSA